jgi:uncharacterized Zn-finger protein
MLGGAAATSISRGHWLVALVLLGLLVVVGVGAFVIWLKRWRGEETLGLATPPDAEAARVCPSCARRYPAGARYCAVDASVLAWVEGKVGSAMLACPRCERRFAGARFCPFDAEELVRADEADAAPHCHVEALHGSDKICPTCAARYEPVAAFCGRDGSKLQPLN